MTRTPSSAQLQGLFLLFHNRLRAANATLAFEEVSSSCRFHYQYMILNDFLPRIVHSSVLDGSEDGGEFDRDKLRFYHFRNDRSCRSSSRPPRIGSGIR